MHLINFLKQHGYEIELSSERLSRLTGSLKIDSRTVERGDIYLAVPLLNGGSNKTYIEEARQRGAELILSLPEGREVWAKWAKACYPSQPEKIVAVTGTNGKSSTVHFVRHLWESAGLKAASLGTLGLVSSSDSFSSEISATQLTSPDSMTLHACLNTLARRGVQHVALEASSHGLDQHRLDEVEFQAAAFTNFSHEHLDYHGTLEKYFQAKCRLFKELLPVAGVAVLNGDDEYGQEIGKICSYKGQSILWFGRREADLCLEDIRTSTKGLALKLKIFSKPFEREVPLIGSFQAENILAALGLAIASGLKIEQVIEGLGALTCVPGRMEYVGQTQGGGVVLIDYAHKPQALKTILKSVRVHASGKVIIVFGCGGNRDREKRKMMGAIACQLADHVIITDDNPRDEKAADIRAEIRQGCLNADEISPREEAIAQGVNLTKPGDICIIAGKGHEQGQIIGSTVLPFEDRKVVRELLQKTGGRLA
jgi:UDP-N-acetylmuramoyl-L-alanyl-D-glutamate--2,6-diaminopimelate ligase